MKLGKGTIKDRIINCLLTREDFVSGDVIAKEIGVSRTIINRYIKELLLEGFDIESRKKEGYKLVSYPDVLYPSLINFRLGELSRKYSIVIFDEIDSTNTYCLKNFDRMNDYTVLIARAQLSGKGRFGREWISEKDRDITMSILLKPNSEVNVLKYIIASSLAVLRTLRSFDVSDLFIKWPNDIYYGGRKLCGILTETSIEMTSKVVEAIVIGIGLNVNSVISEKVENAISLYEILGFQVRRVFIISQILTYFDEFMNMNYDEIFSEWKENMGYLGEEIIVKRGDEELECRFVDVSRSGEIVVEKDRKIMMFSFGEITLRRS